MSVHTTKDGGSAFPQLVRKPVFLDVDFESSGGMTLRDWFAGQVRVGMGVWTPATFGKDATDDNAQRRARAEWAYAEADAMLAAREVAA